MAILAVYLLLVNLAGYLLMGADKKRAQNGLWRIPERTLLTVAALGGGPGVLAGMERFRHKTRHLKFTLGVPAIMAVQLLAAYWLFIR